MTGLLTRSTIVVVTWRGKGHVGACLDAVAAQTRPHRLVVIDNASDDGTAEVLARHPSAPPVVRLPENVGYAGALATVDADTEFTAWLNDDAEPAPDWLARLEDALDQDKSAAAAASRMVGLDGTVISVGVALTPDGHGVDVTAGAGAPPFGFCGGAVLLRSAALREAGGVPARFFCYYEDTDTAWRLRLAGHTIVSVPDAVVTHRHGASTQPGSRQFHLWNERNHLAMLIRCAPASVAVREVARFAAITALLPLRRTLARLRPPHEPTPAAAPPAAGNPAPPQAETPDPTHSDQQGQQPSATEATPTAGNPPTLQAFADNPTHADPRRPPAAEATQNAPKVTAQEPARPAAIRALQRLRRALARLRHTYEPTSTTTALSAGNPTPLQDPPPVADPPHSDQQGQRHPTAEATQNNMTAREAARSTANTALRRTLARLRPTHEPTAATSRPTAGDPTPLQAEAPVANPHADQQHRQPRAAEAPDSTNVPFARSRGANPSTGGLRARNRRWSRLGSKSGGPRAHEWDFRSGSGGEGGVPWNFRTGLRVAVLLEVARTLGSLLGERRAIARGVRVPRMVVWRRARSVNSAS